MALSQSKKRPYLLLEFEYGDPMSPSYQRYTDSEKNITYQNNLYESRDTMVVDFPSYTGTLNEDPFIIDIPIDGFITDLSKEEPHSVTRVRVLQIFESVGLTTPSTVLDMYDGEVSKTIANPGGRVDSVRIRLKNIKQKLNIPLSLIAVATCIWTLGKKGCKGTASFPGVDLSLSQFNSTGTIDLIDGNRVQISALAAKADRFWHRGKVQRNGLSLHIRDWLNGTDFFLAKNAPSSWLGQQVNVQVGCDRLWNTCKNRFNNTRHIVPLGIGMPSHNPTYEDGGL